MAKHQERLHALFYLYQCLLKTDYANGFDKEDFLTLSPRFKKVVLYALNEKDGLAELCNESLHEWEFNRLGYIEQAILLLACSETVCFNIEKQVIINESIIFAKEYGEQDETYKLINATLDKVLNV